MATFCYVCPECGLRQERLHCSPKNPPVAYCACGRQMRRDYRAENVGVDKSNLRKAH